MSEPPEQTSLVDGLRLLARSAAQRPAYTFVDYSADLTGRRQTLTWAEVDRQARGVAAALRRRMPAGARAAVLAPQGLEYVVAMFGAFYARVVAVPLFTPDLPGHQERLSRIIADADPACILTTEGAAGPVSRFLRQAGRAGGHLLTVGLASPEHAGDTPGDAQAEPGTQSGGPAGPDDLAGPRDELPGPHDVAYLQYTSGSTRLPAGVMITHRCLAANAAQISAGLGVERGRATAVGWLPLFHDMGFMMTVAMPVAADAHAVFMDPAAFLMQPVRWLRLASEHPDVYTAGPNFAYEYCANRIGEPLRAGLDLTRVRAFLNGAEPVRPLTLRRFARAFEAHGLRPEALTPAYGLAEATVYVASGRPGRVTRITAFDRQALQRGDAVVLPEDDPEGGHDLILLASCGQPAGQRVAIVDPDSAAVCPAGQVGEIWVNGPNVAPGYFRRTPQDGPPPGEVFGATLGRAPAGWPRHGWLRTGDLGLLHDGELFVTGRLRDLIIIGGRNHYPQDVELTAQDAHPVIRRDRVAAFAVEADGGERLVVVAERSRHVAAEQVDPAEVTRTVRAAVSTRHDIRLHDFLLVQPGAVPRTSSGKIARSACQDRYLARTLDAAS